MRKFILAALLQLYFSIAFAQTFKTGDKIEAYNSGAWYKGTVLELVLIIILVITGYNTRITTSLNG